MVALPEKKQPVSKPKIPKVKKKKTKVKAPPPKKKIKKPRPIHQIQQTEQKNALEKLRQQSAFEKLRTTPEDFKGNKIREGQNLEGLDKVRFDDYSEIFRDHLYRRWSVPRWLMDDKYSAIAIVRIDGQGWILHKELIRSSGNQEFDESILKAIVNSNPFPLPPKSIQSIMSRQKFILGFPRVDR